ncbi:hypothetical protein [Candidatus Cytomitobacter primus]|uniref:Uncharacterized protein n=1 Tax=Candidatus Cytomitobacter primus TaxID=2066024 RepID=A0A5C0UG74_9PROT|nr:hypothetical protein [Candidatus Cytomitobacter primus]QEK38681.1 hypothetical protein FZC34_02045 [Candidatus Cytomitobacter primus]
MLHGTDPDLPVKEYVTVADNGSLVIDAPDFSSHDIKAPCFKPGKVIRKYWCDVRGWVSVHASKPIRNNVILIDLTDENSSSFNTISVELSALKDLNFYNNT